MRRWPKSPATAHTSRRLRRTARPPTRATSNCWPTSAAPHREVAGGFPRCDDKLCRDLGALHLPAPLRRGPGAAHGYRIRERRTRARSPRDWSARRSEPDSPQAHLADQAAPSPPTGAAATVAPMTMPITNSLQAERGGQLGKRRRKLGGGGGDL